MADTRTRDSGATLLEVLVVLAIIATTVTVVTLALPGGASERGVTQEAELLTARLNLATERSLIEGRSFRMEWSADAYEFSELADGVWQASTAETLPAVHDISRAVVLTDASGARRGDVVITPDLMPPSAGVLELSLSADTTQRAVQFDGLTARLVESR